MKPEEIAAYIGAAAWAPQIIVWAYKALMRAKLRCIPNDVAELGFTTLGPILNLRIAFLAQNEDLIIDGMKLKVSHESGDTYELSWAGLGEHFSEITNPDGKKQFIGKDYTPIAINVGKSAVVEKIVRFQEPAYRAADKPLFKEVMGRHKFVKSNTPATYVTDMLASQELFNFIERKKKAMWWKAGKYSVQVIPHSPQKFDLVDSTFDFELLDNDLDYINENIDLVDTNLRDIIRADDPAFKSTEISWRWANVSLSRKGTD